MTGIDAAAHYTRHAGCYDRIATDAPFVTGLRRRIVDALDPGRGDVVVEMGCGTGANLALLRDRVGPGGTVIGVDISAGALERARDRIERAGWRNVHVVHADANRPPLPVERGTDDDVADVGGRRPIAGGRRPIEADAVLATFLTGMLDDPAGAVDGWCRLVGGAGAEGGRRRRRGRLCVAGLARSTRPVGRLLNPAFALAVRATAPPGRDGGRDDGSGRDGGVGRNRRAVEVLDERALAAHRRVHERCSDATTTRALAGFARITAGTVDRR
ncbi:alkanonic acid methyltransferase [Halorubrum sp. 48-1-W]|uniref:class I SAM-dependent methyltransferase n=1 Tax=Halorubrum sp. 48-1-W TaxID=2249761 RepID=UPI000DCBA9EA|nr:methyltransferase domain-containing protein [Halorubrum sp. 48-1-W]RAW46530.1 alkanonic acid methyltransferase [Halorubrum sp. 48-1-W]